MNLCIGENIKKLRLARGDTQERLADFLSVTAPAVSKWERDEAFPDIAMLPLLAEYFGVSVDRLLGIDKTAESEYYDKKYDSEDYYWSTEPSPMCLDVLKYLPPVRPMKLLDIGCGEGKDAVFFARCGYDVSAFDLAEAGLEKTQVLAERARVHINLFSANLLHYRLSESYDVLYSSGVFEYIKPELRTEMMDNYKSHVNEGGLAAFHTFVRKPFIERAPEKEANTFPWKSGELFMYFHDWQIESCSEFIHDCNSSGIPHKHASNCLYAKKISKT